MGPDYSRYDNNTSATQTGTMLYSTHATFYPTCDSAEDLLEAEAERFEEIDKLEDMMYQRGVHETNKHILQHREVKHARLAPIKHKKPHMNRRIIR